MYIAINDIDNGYMVSFTKRNTALSGHDWYGVKIERFYPTAKSVQDALLTLIKEATS